MTTVVALMTLAMLAVLVAVLGIVAAFLVRDMFSLWRRE